MRTKIITPILARPNPVILAALLLAPTWTYVCGGDIMLNGIPPKAKPLTAVAKTFRDAEVSYANLEIPLTGAKTATQRKSAKELKEKSQFILRANPAHVGPLAECGFSWVSLGNNHAMDYRDQGLAQMTGLLAKSGIAWCGAGPDLESAMRLAVVGRAPVRVGALSFLAFQTANGRWKCTPAGSRSAGVAEIALDTKRIAVIVESAKRYCDFLSVALHWGIERKSVPSLYQASLGRAFVDAGADLVVGSHPHVLQGAEVYKRKLILYSMGNLVSPRPARTGLVRISYLGTDLKKLEFLPCSIAGGQVVGVKKGADFQSLCHAVAKKYPNPRSHEPKIVQGFIPPLPKVKK